MSLLLRVFFGHKMASFLQCQCKRCSRTYAITKEYTFLIIPLVSVMILCGLLTFLPIFLSLPVVAGAAFLVYKDATRDVAAETEEELKKMSEITEKTAAEFEKELLAEESAKAAKELEKEKARKLKRQQSLKEENEQLRKAAAAAAVASGESGKKKKKSSTSTAVEEEDELFHAAQFALGAKKAAQVAKALSSSSSSNNRSSTGGGSSGVHNSGGAGATVDTLPENGVASLSTSSLGGPAPPMEKQKKMHLVRDANGWETLVPVGAQ